MTSALSALTATFLSISFPVIANASPELAKSKNCTACHAVDRKLLGPSFKDIAAKYSNDAKSLETLSGRVRNGSTGVWGATMMPANPQVTQAEAEALVKWILSQK